MIKNFPNKLDTNLSSRISYSDYQVDWRIWLSSWLKDLIYLILTSIWLDTPFLCHLSPGNKIIIKIIIHGIWLFMCQTENKSYANRIAPLNIINTNNFKWLLKEFQEIISRTFIFGLLELTFKLTFFSWSCFFSFWGSITDREYVFFLPVDWFQDGWLVFSN